MGKEVLPNLPNSYLKSIGRNLGPEAVNRLCRCVSSEEGSQQNGKESSEKRRNTKSKGKN